jgi:hypothetical protein
MSPSRANTEWCVDDLRPCGGSSWAREPHQILAPLSGTHIGIQRHTGIGTGRGKTFVKARADYAAWPTVSLLDVDDGVAAVDAFATGRGTVADLSRQAARRDSVMAGIAGPRRGDMAPSFRSGFRPPACRPRITTSPSAPSSAAVSLSPCRVRSSFQGGGKRLGGKLAFGQDNRCLWRPLAGYVH